MPQATDLTPDTKISPLHPTLHPLLSTEAQDIAYYLVGRLANQFAAQHQDPEDPDHLMGQKLLKLRNAIWQDPAIEYDPARKEKQRETYNEILATLETDRDRGVFMKLVAQMGHLRQIATLAARDNFFAEEFTNKKDGKPEDKLIPGSPEYFIHNSGSKFQQILSAANAAVFNPVFTAHPTNNSSLDSMKALGDVSKVITSLQKEREHLKSLMGRPTEPNNASWKKINAKLEELDKTLDVYLSKPLTPQNAEGHDENLKAADETSNVLHFMGEIYRQMPATLEEYDRAFEEKAQKENASYDPLKFNPKYRFDSWGSSGDKDGNAKINASTTLQALIQHRKAGLQLYLQDLEALALTRDECQTDWIEPFKQALADINAIEAQFDRAVADQGSKTATELHLVSEESFEAISQSLQANMKNLDFKKFEKDLEEAYPALASNILGDGRQKQALDLLRNARIFGESFGRIEYRETAAEYTKAITYLLEHSGKDYGYPIITEAEKITDEDEKNPEIKAAKEANLKAKEAKKVEILSDLLREENAPLVRQMLAEQWPTIVKEGENKAYTDDKGKPIEAAMVYQSLKRMQLARDFDKAIVKQVLAECEEPSNALETKLLMEFVGQEDAQGHVKRPVMGIVPLFEDPKILAEVGPKMEAIIQNEAYQRHLEDFLDAHPEERVIDPATGEQAIDKRVDENGKEKRPGRPVLVQEVQLAHSDNSRRGGLAAARAYIYDAHRILDNLGDKLGVVIHKFEGGSFSDPFRNGVRAVVGMIKEYGLFDYFKGTMQGGDLPNFFTVADAIKRFLGGVLAYCTQGLLKAINLGKDANDVPTNTTDNITLPALKGTYDDHRPAFTDPSKIGAMWAVLQGDDPASLFKRSISTRANRKPVAFKHQASEEFGDILYLDPNDVRTIVYSEIPQHNQMSPSWFGSYNLIKRLGAMQDVSDLSGKLRQAKRDLLVENKELLEKGDAPPNESRQQEIDALKAQIKALDKEIEKNDPAQQVLVDEGTKAALAEDPVYNKRFGKGSLATSMAAESFDLSKELAEQAQKLWDESRQLMSPEAKDRADKANKLFEESYKATDAAERRRLSDEAKVLLRESKELMGPEAAAKAAEAERKYRESRDAANAVHSFVGRIDKNDRSTLSFDNDPENNVVADRVTVEEQRLKFKKIFAGELNVEEADWRYYLEANNLSADTIRYLYRHSTPFRDEIDKMAYGLVMTDMEAAKTHHPAFADPNTPAGHYFQTEKLPEYVIAATTVYAAFTGKNFNFGFGPEVDENGKPKPIVPKSQDEFLNRVRHTVLTLKDMQPVQQEVESNIALLDFHNTLQAQLRKGDAEERKNRLYDITIKDNALHIQKEQVANKEDKGVTLDLDKLSDAARETLTRVVAKGAQLKVEAGINPHTKQTELQIDGLAALPVERAEWLKVNDYTRPPHRTPEADAAREHLISEMVDVGRAAAHTYNPYLGDRAYNKERLNAVARQQTAQKGMKVA